MGVSFRVSDFALRRVPLDTDPDGGGPLAGLEAIGQIQPINFNGIEHVVNESAVGNAVFRYWSQRTNLPDLTFTLVQASQHPESLGPVTMELLMSATWKEHVVAAPETEHGIACGFTGFFMNPGSRVFDLGTDSPRILTFVPHKLAIGGRSGSATFYDDLSEPEGSAGAMVYIDTSQQIYKTRLNGTGPAVDHHLATRTAMGLVVATEAA